MSTAVQYSVFYHKQNMSEAKKRTFGRVQKIEHEIRTYTERMQQVKIGSTRLHLANKHTTFMQVCAFRQLKIILNYQGNVISSVIRISTVG